MDGKTEKTENIAKDPKTRSMMEKLTIKPFKVKDPEYKSETPEHLRNKYFPGFPSTVVSVGMPGSGKTTVTMNLLSNKDMWCGFFHEIYYYGPTCKADKQYKRLHKDEDKVITNAKQFIPHLSKVLDEQTKKVEADDAKAPRLLFVFEDMTSFYTMVQNKPEFQRCYTQIRHLKGTSLCNVHKWKAFNRTCRVSSQHILFWNDQLTELDQLFEDFGPSNMHIEDWYEMVRYALKPTKLDENGQPVDKPFLYINRFAPPHLRFRKSFTQYLVIPEQTVDRGLSSKRKKKQTKRPKKKKRSRSSSPQSTATLADIAQEPQDDRDRQ